MIRLFGVFVDGVLGGDSCVDSRAVVLFCWLMMRSAGSCWFFGGGFFEDDVSLTTTRLSDLIGCAEWLLMSLLLVSSGSLSLSDRVRSTKSLFSVVGRWISCWRLFMNEDKQATQFQNYEPSVPLASSPLFSSGNQAWHMI